MASFDNEFNQIMAAAKEQSATEREHLERATGIKDGVNWAFGLTPVGERPFIQVTCSSCRTQFRTEQLEFTWRHCGVKSVCPPELSERLKKAQIKRGIRKATSFVDRLLGKETAPAAINNF
jgi:hypothetical protein